MQEIDIATDWKIKTQLHPESIAYTRPPDTWRALINQRSRWASTGKNYSKFSVRLYGRDHAGRQMGLDRLISQIHPDNRRSRALAERLGAVQERETTLLGDPCLIYRHPSVLEDMIP